MVCAIVVGAVCVCVCVCVSFIVCRASKGLVPVFHIVSFSLGFVVDFLHPMVFDIGCLWC